MTGRNGGIDALRGASIMLVVMHHLAIRRPLGHSVLAGFVPGRLLDALCWNGYESVFVFFVISGFLIAGNALDRWPALGRPDFRGFYTRRAARILPCLVALVAVLAALHLVGLPDYRIHRPGQSLPGAVIAALGFQLNWYEGRTGYLPGNWDVLWSLSIEEVFYILFPLACLLARRSLVPFVAVLALLALSLPMTRAALASNEIWQEKAYLPGMAAIATGVLAALLARRWRPGPRGAWALIATGLAAWLAILFVEDVIWKRLGNASMLVLTLGVAALLIGLRARPLAAPAWLRAYGRMSYEIYLTHMFVVFSLLRLVPVTAILPLYPAALGLALLLGWLVARLMKEGQGRCPWTPLGPYGPRPH